MKKKICTLLIAFIASIFTLSCTKEDFTDPDNLVGTSWRCTSGPYFDDEEILYETIIFTSTSEIEIWYKYTDGEEEYGGDAMYTIDGNEITINADYELITGEINGKRMTLIADGDRYVFVKQ